MIKLAEICVIFLSARLIYENYVEKTEDTAKKIENIILFADLLYINVMELKIPLESAVSMMKFKISPFIDELSDKFSDSCIKKQKSSAREIIISEFSKINTDKRVKREINRFLSVIGNSDKETVKNYKNIAVKNCEDYLTQWREKSKERQKTAGALTAGIGVILAVILI